MICRDCPITIQCVSGNHMCYICPNCLRIQMEILRQEGITITYILSCPRKKFTPALRTHYEKCLYQRVRNRETGEYVLKKPRVVVSISEFMAITYCILCDPLWRGTRTEAYVTVLDDSVK